jgi:hypothetical protein
MMQEEAKAQEEMNYVEDGDDILVDRDSLKDPDDDLDEPAEPPETDKEGEEPGETPKDKPEGEEAKTKVPEGDDPYAGKSREEIIEMHRNASSKIGQMGSEIGKFRKDLDEIKATLASDPKDAMTSRDLKDTLSKEKEKLSKLDPDIDEDDYKKQQLVISKIEEDYLEKRQDELLEARFNSHENEAFLTSYKDRLEKDGIELTDSEYKEISNLAKQYSGENRRITEKEMHHAMIDVYGVDKVASFFKMSGEQKARKDIQAAESKVKPTVSTKGTSERQAKLVKFDELDGYEREKFLASLSDTELQKIMKKRNLK